MKNSYVRYPRGFSSLPPSDTYKLFLHILLSAAETPCLLRTDVGVMPVGRGEIYISIRTLAGQLHVRPLHIKRALLYLADRCLIELPHRLPANHENILITILRYYRYSSYICDTPDTVRVYRSIMDKPWYTDTRVKTVYLHLLTHTSHTRQIGGAKSDCSIAELAYVAGVRKAVVQHALKILSATSDIDYMSTDRRCVVTFRAPPDEQVIHVNFRKAGSEMG